MIGFEEESYHAYSPMPGPSCFRCDLLRLWVCHERDSHSLPALRVLRTRLSLRCGGPPSGHLVCILGHTRWNIDTHNHHTFFADPAAANPYLIQIPSLHSSFDRERLLVSVGWMDIHAPASSFWRVQRASRGSTWEQRVVKVASVMALPEVRALALPLSLLCDGLPWIVRRNR